MMLCRVQLLRAGDLTGALSLARTELTPLANKSPELLPLLKASGCPSPAKGGGVQGGTCQGRA